MAVIPLIGRKVTLSIPNAGSASDVLDLGGSVSDVARASQVMIKGSAAGADLILLNGQEAVTVLSIVSVVQGATTYVPTTDYVLGTNTVDWSPAGAEPAVGSQYTVTYTYTKPAAAKSYRRWDAQIICLAAALTGTVSVQISDTPTVAGNFRNLQSGGADITIAANKAVSIIPLVARYLRLVSSGTEAAQRDFVVMVTTITDH